MEVRVEKMLTVPEVQAFLRCGRKAVISLIRQERLHAVRVGTAYRIPSDALQDFLDRQRAAPRPAA